MKSKISALMDGELDSEDVAGTITQLKKTDGLRDEWATYHLIGDALRQSITSVDITQRVSTRLAAEPTVLAPQSPMEHKFKVFALSAAASVAAVAVVGWMSLQNMDRPQENLASNKPVLQPAVQTTSGAISIPVAGSILAPAHINGYLLAHRGFSATPAMHGVVPYIRTATESRENSAR
ncbi:MAG: sigma-E factor negative regulatory protein [Nitrosomonadaceae bacterium]|nr:sigma-E factor negative regulatory protein [Nitrosomonadaceae bacterium]